MADTTLFELVSPERLVISKDVRMVVVPGVEGLFGVLPRHTAMLSTLVPGVIDVYEEDVVSEKWFVVNGFAEVTEERCTVLAEEVIPLDELDPEHLENKIARLREEASAAAGSDADKLNASIAEQEVILLAMQKAKQS
ncbi:MAG: ATP synthase F1 subunit epsilon [Rhodospirillaceae bacterium]|nr:ATP synthase F1 subunit epsilon [Rhodospirillaceae bacterium]|tara:strand:- start:1566 stop:1979 length:414 start_codon:yes stop_codon:yes gene_type:complete